MTNARTIRWGILSTGHIANEFVEGLAELPATEVVAVGSRTLSKANTFADTWNIRKRHGSYEALVSDPEVDIVYIGTPHPFHRENSLLCLNAGKAVLCEKPFAMNAKEALEVITTAKQKELFIMDAIWVLFLPHMVKLRELIKLGAIGEVRQLTADFGFRTDFDPASRLFDLSLGGGALLDVGLYPLLLAQSLLGEPARIESSAHLSKSGVDETNSILLSYSAGQTALLSSALRLDTPNEAVVVGTEGRVHFESPWWRPGNLTLYRGDAKEHIEVSATLLGHNYEALEVNRCLREERLESDIMPLDSTLMLMETLDSLRAAWGLRYPADDS